jgi:transcriptional antiterminator RfaH
MNDGFGAALDEAPAHKHAMRWIAINTHPHREPIAIENLLRQKFAVYCPMELRRIRHARRTQDVTRPLFPGYIFAEVMPDLALWRPILSTYGVRSMVRSGDRPAFVESGFIQGLRDREIDGVIARPLRPYTVGQDVRLHGGPFDGLIATIIEMDERDRLVLLTSLLNQTVRLKVTGAGVRAL